MQYPKPKKRNKSKSWTTIKRSLEDDKYSIMIRHLANWTCENCGRKVNPEVSEGRAVIHCSHYFGRGRQGTRFDQGNTDCLCAYCHKLLGSIDPEAYRVFKIKKLGGLKRFNALTLRANLYHKKDLKLVRLWLRSEFERLGLDWKTGRVL